MSNQVISWKKIDLTRIIFEKPEKPKGAIKADFMRINVMYAYPNGGKGKFLVKLPEVFTYGLEVNENYTTKREDGWVMTFCLFDRGGATPQQMECFETLKRVVDHCRKHLLEVREDAGQPDLVVQQLTDEKFSFVKHKKSFMASR